MCRKGLQSARIKRLIGGVGSRGVLASTEGEIWLSRAYVVNVVARQYRVAAKRRFPVAQMDPRCRNPGANLRTCAGSKRCAERRAKWRAKWFAKWRAQRI